MLNCTAKPCSVWGRDMQAATPPGLFSFAATKLAESAASMSPFMCCRDGVRSAEIIQRQQSLAASFGREAEQMQTFTALIEGHLHDTIAQSNTQKADLSEVVLLHCLDGLDEH